MIDSEPTKVGFLYKLKNNNNKKIVGFDCFWLNLQSPNLAQLPVLYLFHTTRPYSREQMSMSKWHIMPEIT